MLKRVEQTGYEPLEYDHRDPDKWWRPQLTGWTFGGWVVENYPLVAFWPPAYIWLSLWS